MEINPLAWVMKLDEETKLAEVIVTFLDDKDKMAVASGTFSDAICELLKTAMLETISIIPVAIKLVEGRVVITAVQMHKGKAHEDMTSPPENI